jgi:predicted amidophosphoribosyltransferase
VICPACEYEFDPAGGVACPRCGETLSCSGVSCAECDACSGLVDRLRTTVADRFRRENDGRAGDGSDSGRDQRSE